MPPSRGLSGGSSTRAASSDSRRSGQASSRSRSSAQQRRRRRRPASGPRRGSRPSVRATASRSRGEARPVLTRAVSRCRSNTPPSMLAQIAALRRVLVEQFGDGLEPRLDLAAVGQRREQPVAQQAGPHRRDGAVDRRPAASPSRCRRAASASAPGCGASPRRGRDSVASA